MAIAATALCLLAAAGERPAFHAVAFVNDPLSHGVLGDGLLSLNEAILLHNGQLALAQLSAAEQAQLSLIPGTGSTTDVTWIDIDAANTTVITIQQNLAPVLDTSFGLLIKGFGGRPILDFSGANVTQGLVVPANSVSLQDLVFAGGPFGVDVTQTDASGQAGATLGNVRFENQAQFGLRVHAVTANGVGRVVLQNCEFEGVPSAILHDESGSGRTTIFECYDLFVRGAAVGFDGVLGGGGSTRFSFDRVDIEASTLGLRLQRPSGANRTALLEGDFVRIRAPSCAEFACHPTALTWAVLRLWDLQAGPGGTALHLGNAGDAWFGEVSELDCIGSVRLAAGGASQPIALTNLRVANSPVVFATSATQSMTLDAARMDNCAVTATGSGPVVVTDSNFLGGSLAGTATAPFVLAGSFAPSAGAHVQASSPVPTANLGRMSIAPENVQAGGSVTFQADLPVGLLGLFVLGATPSAPLLSPPFRVFVDPSSYAFWPGAFVLQQSATWQIPAGVQFLGLDFTVQMVVLPGAGMQAPWLQMPPGRRFVLR